MVHVCRRQRLGESLLALVLSLVLLSACSAQPATPAKAPAAAAPAPAKKALTKIQMGISAPGLDFAPVYVAQALNYFADEGIDMELVTIRGGAATTAALKTGEVQFGGNAAQDVVLAREQGIDAIAMGAFPLALYWNFAAKQEFMRAKGLAANASVEQKIQAMKGVNVGVPTVGGGPSQVARFLLMKYGLRPDADVQFVAVGAGAARIAALRQNQVEVIVGGIPDTEQPELEGWGKTFLRLSHDVPLFQRYPHEALVVLADYAKKNPDLVRAMARALARGNNLIMDQPTAANQALAKALPELKPDVLDPVMALAKGLFGRNMRMDQKMWSNAEEVLRGAGIVKANVDISEGKLWTNQYLPGP